MPQRRIWLAFLFVMAVGVAVSARIIYLGDSVQAVNHSFISEKLPLSQRIGELRGVIADEERSLYELYSFTTSKEVFQTQRKLDKQRLYALVDKLEADRSSNMYVPDLRKRLWEFDQLSDSLYSTLAVADVDWDKSRMLLASVKPKVRQIEAALGAITMANRMAVNDLGSETQQSVSTMVRWVICFSVLIFGIAGFVGYYVVAIVREGLERRRLSMFPERDPNPVLRLGVSGEVAYANPATFDLLDKLNLTRTDLNKFLPAHLHQYLAKTNSSINPNIQFEYTHGEHILECTVSYLADFSEYHVYLKDVTARKQAEEALAYKAFFDPATGLPNQYSLREDIFSAHRTKQLLTLLMIVPDREQEVLENFGTVNTERWLVKISSRLNDGINAEKEKLYRFGNSAFVLLRWSDSLTDAQDRARQLLSTQRPLHIERREYFSTLSIGIALMEYGNDMEMNAEALVQHAASACNRTRRSGGNDFAIYDEQMALLASRTLTMASDLHNAVENGELRLLYQPKIEPVSGRLLGMEALVRWIHPERGMISPIEFIPVAEDTGLIVPIGNWVLREACRQNAEWQRAGLPPLRVAVNLSARQLRAGNLLAEIDGVLAETGLPVSSLELEITESMVMDDPEGVIKLLSAIHERGIHLALDDFGTGHSSLAYLKRFPIDCVKIDRAFIKDTPANADDVAIARMIVAMAQTLNLHTVAEGVENIEQLELLKSIGCDQIQGFYYSRPLAVDDFLEFYLQNLSAKSIALETEHYA